MKRQPPPPPCPRADLHTPAPADYLDWHAWAERMSRTHRQRCCPECGLYAIWEPKPAAAEETRP